MPRWCGDLLRRYIIKIVKINLIVYDIALLLSIIGAVIFQTPLGFWISTLFLFSMNVLSYIVTNIIVNKGNK